MIFPVILDSRPEFLGDAADTRSLLLAHVGARTLLECLADRLRRVSDAAPSVLADFAHERAYVEGLRSQAPGLREVVKTRDFRSWLAGCEPSDFLLLVDPRCFPVDGFEDQLVLRHPGVDPRWAHHLVAMDRSASGTRERLDVDASGLVRRIQRHYEAVTWPFCSGVACSILPASCGLVLDELSFASLGELRRALAAAGVPSRDLPLQCAGIDLTREAGLLELNEALVLEACAGALPEGGLRIGDGQLVHPTARLVGPVVLHAGVEVGADAVVLGPTMLGPGVRVGEGAVVAQSLLASGAHVPPGRTLRHRAVFERLPASPPALREGGPPLYAGAEAPHAGGTAATAAPGGGYLRVKPVLEGVLSAIALALLSPLLLFVALLIRLDSKGPALYSQRREGRQGRPFRCFKFRTMHDGAETLQRALSSANQMDGPQFKIERDPRITRVGRWLRPTNIDEIPQLINVALGQMSLVGPRPSPFRENQLCVPWREGRLSVRPGITGLWQICRRDRLKADFHQWIEFDLLYVRHLGFWVDLKILLATLWTVGGRTSVPLAWILPFARRAAGVGAGLAAVSSKAPVAALHPEPKPR